MIISCIGDLLTVNTQILPTYPCTQPSDTLAFRNALTKYMETLKQAVLHPGTAGNDLSFPTTSAWWWKDVIIRKSLLEECHGERCVVSLVVHGQNTRLPCSLGLHGLSWHFQHTHCFGEHKMCPCIRLNRQSDSLHTYALLFMQRSTY